MKKVITFAAAALLTSSVFAGTHTAHSSTHFSTDSFASKAEAYDAGFGLVDQISDMNESQLRNKLTFVGGSGVRNIKVGDTEVTIEEFAETRGQIAYRAIVNVDYSYTAHESNND
ncbi:DUF3316 domain-containing protein [Vibrio sp. HN007]|uniref:DUF3316 domain-containing protein n=1 Tax=Vibrio iocasae TaxID=3098914 RepID=UPI0035D3D98A